MTKNLNSFEWRRIASPAATLVATLSLTSMATSQESHTQAFADANRVAMMKMMAGMDAQPSGSIDRDFARMMIPHHQGAVDMAIAELRYGHDERLRRLAQEIVVTQQQEIAVMQAILEKP